VHAIPSCSSASCDKNFFVLLVWIQLRVGAKTALTACVRKCIKHTVNLDIFDRSFGSKDRDVRTSGCE